MEIRQFVHGKFEARHPEYDIRIVDSISFTNNQQEEYREIKNYILNNFNHIFYGQPLYSFVLFPEIITRFRDNYLFIKFFPPFQDQRHASALVDSLFHCLIFNENELKAINYNLWEVREKFIKKYEKTAITGNDNTVWLAQEEAAAQRDAKVVRIEVQGNVSRTVDSQDKSEEFSNYYAVLTDYPEALFNKLMPSRKLGIFASGLVLNGDPELLTKLTNQNLRFALLSTIYEKNIPSSFILLNETVLATLTPIPKPEKAENDPGTPPLIPGRQNDLADEKHKQVIVIPDRDLVNPHLKVPVNSGPFILQNPDPGDGHSKLLDPSPLKPHEADQLGSISAQSKPIGDLVVELKYTNQLVYLCLRNRFNDSYHVDIEKEDAPESFFNMNHSNVVISPKGTKEIVDREVELGRKYKYTINLKKNIIHDLNYEASDSLEVVMSPNPVTKIESNFLNESNIAEIKWIAPHNSREVEYLIIRYIVDESKNRSEQFRKRLAVNETTYTDNDLPTDKKILYTIIVIDKLNMNVSEPCETEEILVLPYHSTTPIIPLKIPRRLPKTKSIRNYVLVTLFVMCAGFGTYIILSDNTSAKLKTKEDSFAKVTKKKQDAPPSDSSPVSSNKRAVNTTAQTIGTTKTNIPKIEFLLTINNDYKLEWRRKDGKEVTDYHYNILRNTSIIKVGYSGSTYMDPNPDKKSESSSYTLIAFDEQNISVDTVNVRKKNQVTPPNRSGTVVTNTENSRLEMKDIRQIEILRTDSIDHDSAKSKFDQKFIQSIKTLFKKKQK